MSRAGRVAGEITEACPQGAAWGRQCDQVDPWQASTPTSCLTVHGALPVLLPPSFSHPNAQICKSVVACRVSPDQKRSIVHLVKNNEPACRALSIGKAEEREGVREGGREGGGEGQSEGKIWPPCFRSSFVIGCAYTDIAAE